MNSIVPAPLRVGDEEGFPSAAALRTAHSGLLRRERIERDQPAFRAEVLAFIQSGRMTGKILDDPAERRATQSVLDYWATVVYRGDGEIIDSTLEEFDRNLAPFIPEESCPYLGLESFSETQHALFFGRRRMVDEYLNYLASHRMLAVVGSSGTGKSSLVLGGVLPELQAGALPGSAGWGYVPRVVPGKNPLRNLAESLFAFLLKTYPQARQQLLARRDEWLERFVAGALGNPDYLHQQIDLLIKTPVALVVDQFEELFTLCDGEEERRAFIGNLLTLVEAPGRRHTLIVTMRREYDSYVARFEQFYEVFKAARVRVEPMVSSEIMEAIEEPARRVGLKIDPRVAASLAKDVVGEPAALPLLQFTLLKLWEDRDHNRVTWESYKRLGGGRIALERSADAFFDNLSRQRQTTVRRILLRMVRPAEGLDFTSSRVQVRELHQIGEPEEGVDEVLRELIKARLVRLTPGPIWEDSQAEVAHEALVRNWKKLSDWLEKDRAALRERQRLLLAAENWKARGEDPEALLRGATLSDALRSSPDNLGRLEREFLRASLRDKIRIEQEEEAARRHEIEQARALAEEQRLRAEAERQRAEEQEQRAKIERKRAEERARAARRFRLVALALAVVSVVAAIAAIYAFRNAIAANQQRVLADQQRAVAVAAQSTSEAARATANAAKETAVILRQTAQTKAETFAIEKAQAETAKAQAVVAQQAAQTTAQANATAKAQADAARSQAEAAAAQARTAEADNATRANGLQQTTVAQAAFADILQQTAKALGTQNQTLQSQLNTGKLAEKAMQALSADDTQRALQLAIAASTFSKEQKVEDALQAAIAQSTSPIQHGYRIASISWNRDNRRLVSVGSDTTVRIWDTETRQQIGAFDGHFSRITDAVWSPDGKRVVSTDVDGIAIVWDAATGQEITRFTDHTGTVRSASWSPDSRLIVSSGDDNVLRIWEAASARQVKRILNVPATITETAWSPDGKRFVVATGNDATIYDADGNQIATLSSHSALVRSAAWNPNRKTIATASDDGTVKIWDANSGQLQTTLNVVEGGGGVNSARWYPSGNYLVTAGDDQTVRIWDMKDISQSRQLATLKPGATPVMAAWNASGLRLATASSDGSIRIYYVLFDDILKEAQRLTQHQLTPDEIKAELEKP